MVSDARRKPAVAARSPYHRTVDSDVVEPDDSF